MPSQHLARDLGITGLVRTQQAEMGESKEEKKPAKTGEERPVCNTSGARR
jgi:hypothetical protein